MEDFEINVKSIETKCMSEIDGTTDFDAIAEKMNEFVCNIGPKPLEKVQYTYSGIGIQTKS